MHEARSFRRSKLAPKVSGKLRGQGTGSLRDLIIADMEEAMALRADSDVSLAGLVRGLRLLPRLDGPGVMKNFATAKESNFGYALAYSVDSLTHA